MIVAAEHFTKKILVVDRGSILISIVLNRVGNPGPDILTGLLDQDPIFMKIICSRRVFFSTIILQKLKLIMKMSNF